MRTLLKAKMEIEHGNKSISDGSMQRVLDSLITDLKPEAAYFTTVHGRRTMFLVFDLKDPSQIPSIAEPLFQKLGAEITFSPVMNREDLAKGLKSLETKKAA